MSQSQNEQRVRDIIKNEFESNKFSLVRYALKKAQEIDAADKLSQELFINCNPDNLVKFNNMTHPFYTDYKEEPIEIILFIIKKEIAKIILKKYSDEVTSNRHLRGGRCDKKIDHIVNRYSDDIKREIDSEFEKKGTAKLANNVEIRRTALNKFTIRCFDYCKGTNIKEDYIKYRLKALAALLLPNKYQEKKENILHQLVDGKTRSFPFIHQHLSLHPNILEEYDFETDVTLAGFTPDLISTCPESELIKSALDRYLNNQGLLSDSLDPSSPIHESVKESFDQLPSRIPSPVSGIIAPKDDVLSVDRKKSNSFPEGCISSIALAVLLEWCIHQIYYISYSKTFNGQQVKAIRKLFDDGIISGDSKNLLDQIFDSKSDSIRNALAHGTIIIGQREYLDRVLTILSQAMASLSKDIQSSGRNYSDETRWDSPKVLNQNEENTIAEQIKPGLYLVDQMGSDEPRQVLFDFVGSLVPDKSFIYKASFYLWISEKSNMKKSIPANKDRLFLSLFGVLIVFEELYRAIAEEHNIEVLKIQHHDSDTIFCRFKMLTTQANELLEDPTLKKIVTDNFKEAEFHDSIAIIMKIRDSLFHGNLKILDDDLIAIIHLMHKMCYTFVGSLT